MTDLTQLKFWKGIFLTMGSHEEVGYLKNQIARTTIPDGNMMRRADAIKNR
jgi:hypothetical protein